MINYIKENRVFFYFLFFYTVTMLILIPQFGSNYMEYFHLNYGDMTLNQILPEGLQLSVFDTPPLRHKFHHGAFWHTFQSLWEYLFNMNDLGEKLLFRHYSNFLFFAFSLTAFYSLLQLAGLKTVFSLLGTMLLALYPRILNHSIVNPSDIPTMMCFVLSFYTLLRYTKEKTLKNLIFHIFMSGFLVGGIKPFGVYIVGATLLSIVNFSTVDMTKKLKTFLIYSLGVLALTYILFPTLWSDPFYMFYKSIGLMKVYAWTSERYHNPWWMFLTLPLYLSASFILSLIFIIRKIARNSKKSVLMEIQFLLWVLVPILAPIILNIAGYDGWRHHYFIYPAMIIILMMFLQCLSEKHSAYVNLFATFSLLHLLVLNIYLHPYQSQYFNIFAKYMYGQDIYRTQRTSISTGSYFYKAYQIIAKKYLSKFPKDKKVVIISNSPPAEINRVLLDNELSARFKVYGSREISKDLKLEFNTCLEKFLTVYGKENEGATFTYDNSNNSLQVWGNLNLFPKDRIAECYSDSQTLERLDEFYKNGQFTQGYKKVGRLLFDEGDFYVGPYERPGLDTLETIKVDKRPVMYIQKINPYRPYIL